MNILYHFRTRGTGEAVHISGVANAFEKLGHRVVFSSPTGIDPRKTAGVSSWRVTGKGSMLDLFPRFCRGPFFELLEIAYNVPACWRNHKILKAGSFDLIYERHAFFLGATAWLARYHGIPLVVEVNELVGDARVRKQPLFAPIARGLDKFLFRQSSLIVVVSPYLRRKIQGMGIAGEKIMVLPNAVDAEEYSNISDGARIRQRLGLQGKIVIGFIGWFVEWHRLDIMLEVFADLAASRPALRFLLVGEGLLRARLVEQVRKLGIDEHVVFSGTLPHKEIPEAIAAMDVCVVPHSNEYRSPLKLFEYMGQGRLVVAPATEPLAMVVRDGENGLLFAQEDPASLRKVLARAVDDPMLRKCNGEQARRDVLDKHTWIHNTQAVLNALRNNSGCDRGRAI